MQITLTDQNFKEEVLQSRLPVLVDFWAPWCAPCHAIAPAVEAISRGYEGRLRVGKLNVDENPQVTAQYQVRSIPTLKIFRSGKIVEEIIGAVPQAELTRKVQKHI